MRSCVCRHVQFRYLVGFFCCFCKKDEMVDVKLIVAPIAVALCILYIVTCSVSLCVEECCLQNPAQALATGDQGAQEVR